MNTTTPSESGRAPHSPFFRPSSVHRSFVLKRLSGGKGSDQAVPLKDLEKKSSLLGAYANLCNVCIGAGIVGLPYAVKEAGLVAGTIMILVCAFLTDYSLRLVVSAGKIVNVNSYETLLEAAFGHVGFLFVTLSMFFLSYGSMVAYLIIIKDSLPILFGISPEDIDMKRIIMFVSSFLVALPLGMQKDMANLDKTSSLNVVLDLCLVVLVVGFSPVVKSVNARGGILEMISDETFLDLRTFFVGFGVCSFAFVCQDSSFIIAGSMKTPSKQRWKRVTNMAMITVCTLEITLGIAGYLAYQDNTRGNVLNNMDAYHWSGVVSRGMLATTMFFAYPMNMYIARHAFMVVFFQGGQAHEGNDSIVLMRRDRRIILTSGLYILSLIPAMLMDSTGKVLAATGAVAGSSIAYIGPGLAILAIHGSEFLDMIRKRWSAQSQLWGYPTNIVSAEAGEDGKTLKKNGVVQVDEAQPDHDENIEPMSSHQAIPESSMLDIILWYALAFPIWSAIAQFGQKNLNKHFDKNMLSPSVVKPKRVSLMVNAHLTSSPTSQSVGLVRSTSAPKIDEEMALLSKVQAHFVSDYGGAKMIASKNSLSGELLQKTNSLTPAEVESELNEEAPTWANFWIAVAFIVLGVMAMIFGLISILLL